MKAGIPAQWQRFGPHIGHIPAQVGGITYGVVYNGDGAGNIDYLCGVEVSDPAKVPAEWSQLRIPEQKYAVFTHREHISAIRRTWFSIYKWLAEAGYKTAGAPEFELYPESFNPMTGLGGVEIWIPIKS